MKIKWVFSSLIVLFIVPVIAYGSFGDSEIFPCEAGMGNTGVGLTKDVTATYRNPAGLWAVDEICEMIFLAGSIASGEGHLAFIGFAQPYQILWGGSIGISYLFEDVLTPESPPQNTGVQQESLILSFGKSPDLPLRLTKKIYLPIAFGANIKLLKTKTAEDESRGFSLDGGLQFFKVNIGILKNTDMGLVVQNLIGSAPFDDDLTTSFRFGMARPLKREINLGELLHIEKFVVAWDTTKDETTSFKQHIGIKSEVNHRFPFRWGLDDWNMTIGTGYTIFDWKFDYSYSGADSGIHLISATLSR